jgi:rhodanese-related sulfurtransferase
MAIDEITVGELEQRLAAGARLVDVREPDEYANGHVPGAVSVPLATVPEQLEVFGGDSAPLVICQAGSRSLLACELLDDHGIEAINVAGGTGAWSASGRELVS